MNAIAALSPWDPLVSVVNNMRRMIPPLYLAEPKRVDIDHDVAVLMQRDNYFCPMF